MVELSDPTTHALAPTDAFVCRRAQPAIDTRAATTRYRRHGKRVLDVALVCLSAVVVLPLLALLCILVALDGGSPLYWQQRIGQNGVGFRMLKLRTMVPDADDALGDILRDDPALAREWDSHQKLRHDPRVTGLGRLLRATSLDELPQLWNVFRGEMSIVGPRPMMPDQRGMYHGALYSNLRPGVTGLWQVSARNSESFGSRADYDRQYSERLSLGLDIRLMGRTMGVVLRGTGC